MQLYLADGICGPAAHVARISSNGRLLYIYNAASTIDM